MPDPEPWLILVVDDDSEAARQVKEIVEGGPAYPGGSGPVVSVETNFEIALGELERGRYDLVILDVRLGEGSAAGDEAGVRTLEAIRARRFVPIVFYTAIPEAVRPLASPPLVDVVEKAAGAEALSAAVDRVFESGLPLVNRALLRHVEEVQRRYLWEFVASHWADIGASTDRASLAVLLARRLAVSLSGSGVEALEAALGGVGEPTPTDKVPPMRMYLLPPLAEVLVGDIVHGSVGDREGYWVVLSPSCDLVQGKADFVLLAGADPLADLSEARAWRADLPSTPSRSKNKTLAALLANNRTDGQSDRHHFLPGALMLPDLVIDFQRMQAIDSNAFGELTRAASIDSPYAEAIVTRFLRFYSRVGTPDVDMAQTLERLRLLGPSPAE